MKKFFALITEKKFFALITVLTALAFSVQAQTVITAQIDDTIGTNVLCTTDTSPRGGLLQSISISPITGLVAHVTLWDSPYISNHLWTAVYTNAAIQSYTSTTWYTNFGWMTNTTVTLGANNLGGVTNVTAAITNALNRAFKGTNNYPCLLDVYVASNTVYTINYASPGLPFLRGLSFSNVNCGYSATITYKPF